MPVTSVTFACSFLTYFCLHIETTLGQILDMRYKSLSIGEHSVFKSLFPEEHVPPYNQSELCYKNHLISLRLVSLGKAVMHDSNPWTLIHGT